MGEKGDNGNYREQKIILKKKKKKSSSHLPVQNLLQLRETGRISDEHYSVQAVQLPGNYDLTSRGTIGERICMNLLSVVCIFATIV